MWFEHALFCQTRINLPNNNSFNEIQAKQEKSVVSRDMHSWKIPKPSLWHPYSSISAEFKRCNLQNTCLPAWDYGKRWGIEIWYITADKIADGFAVWTKLILGANFAYCNTHILMTKVIFCYSPPPRKQFYKNRTHKQAISV